MKSDYKAPGLLKVHSRKEFAMGFKGLAWTTIQSWLSVTTQISLMIVLSRLISPSDFGMYALAFAPVALVSTMAELGIGAAIVRSHSEVYLIAGNGICLAAITSILGISSVVVLSIVLQENGEVSQGAASLMLWLAPTVLLSTFSSCGLGVLQRAQRFKSMAIVEILAQVINALVTITCAIVGYKSWALLCGTLAFQTTKMVSVLMLALPKPRFKVESMKEILVFSSGFVWLKLINTASSTIDRLLVAEFFKKMILHTRKRLVQFQLYEQLTPAN